MSSSLMPAMASRKGTCTVSKTAHSVGDSKYIAKSCAYFFSPAFAASNSVCPGNGHPAAAIDCLWIGAVTSAEHSFLVTRSSAASIDASAIFPYSASITPYFTGPRPPTLTKSMPAGGSASARLPKTIAGTSTSRNALKTISAPMPAGSPRVMARGFTARF